MAPPHCVDAGGESVERLGVLGEDPKIARSSRVEIEFLNQCESIYAGHVEITAHVRQLSVGPGPVRFGMLGGYYRSILSINERIGDKKRVSSYRYNFLIG